MARDRETDLGFSLQEALGWLGKQLEDEAAKMEVPAADAGGEDPMVARGVASGVAGRETPGAVAWAGLGRRLWAQIVDVALLGTVAGIQVAVFGTNEVVLIGIITGVVATFYYVGFWGSRGQTPGKMALGIEVVTPVCGGLIGPGRALIRYLFLAASIALVVPLVLNFFTVKFDKRRRGVHDFLSGTCVSRAY